LTSSRGRSRSRCCGIPAAAQGAVEQHQVERDVGGGIRHFLFRRQQRTLGGEDLQEVCHALFVAQPRDAQRALRLVADYSMPNVSDKVVRIIHSYTDYVNRVVWKKY
jgi:hypothetical protein